MSLTECKVALIPFFFFEINRPVYYFLGKRKTGETVERELSWSPVFLLPCLRLLAVKRLALRQRDPQQHVEHQHEAARDQAGQYGEDAHQIRCQVELGADACADAAQHLVAFAGGEAVLVSAIDEGAEDDDDDKSGHEVSP